MATSLGKPVLCLPLMAVFASLAVISFTQFGRLSRRAVGWTTQRILHALVFMVCTVRVVFFLVALNEWDLTTGTLKNYSAGDGWHSFARMIFYASDELPALLLFTIYSAVVLFWAELYLIAADNMSLYEQFLYPLHSICNLCAFLILGMLLIMYATEWKTEDYYITTWYAMFLSSLYLVAASGFWYIGRSAATELKQVPIELQMRKKLLKEVGMITLISTTCMVFRAAVLITVMNQPLYLDRVVPFSCAVAYFVLLEGLPLVVVLVFYRRMPLPSRELLPEEGKLLGNQPFSYQGTVDMGMGGGPGGGWSVPDPSRSTLSVEESIKRLSAPEGSWDGNL
mmetsp:Transcript_74500/g.212417  ORF Transcript_74500/g.212417 Transcript_74500/m.212417 type:complete len:339 (+) Transcript_74500:127-1143(+)|eukprot:CAMPEP_0119520158 /NCGR_PEP_ID=MMETSP1344-20130328/36234_1 /TAXON_ID=236787 /ORGANISM="Florenciella parvula, Strain CCMP2471" /LENGTH=338 /DNA_ID=CAMNT_0007558011 /DNA_START=104 /DNA_END=1120 /DNA_ORIENTATION=+